jgi:hypothetical protein
MRNAMSLRTKMHMPPPMAIIAICFLFTTGVIADRY